jgi:predicted alpha/beta hydrolase family esterase
MIDLNDENLQILFVPPWENAGAEHWMSIWQEKYPKIQRVGQRDWMNPNREEWIAALDRYVGEQTKPVVLVAHSLGTIAVAHWSAKFEREIKGAFLVAPPDVESADAPEQIKGFAPVPRAAFDFPSAVVASETDIYCSIERAEFFARSWNSRFINIGKAGHINTKSGHGEWVEGERLLAEFILQNR